jgi:anaerobic selenocysteine-containing dehydrogenase
LRERVARYFDPLPYWYEPLERDTTDLARYPLAAVTQRPMAMYHSWDSQNAWLRQIHGENYLFMNPLMAREQGIEDGGWIYVESQWGKVRCMARYSEAVEPGTVWTWNAIGKAAGAWNLGPDANESQRGFLLNHLITDELPTTQQMASRQPRMSNSDPITGQAAWYDVRVRIYPAEADADHTLPQFAPMQPMPGSMGTVRRIVQTYFAGRGEFAARLRNTVKRD